MAGGMTDYTENGILNLMRGTGLTAYTAYLALFTATPSDIGGGTEVTGTGYARQSVTFAAPVSGAMATSADVVFPVAGSAWGTITHHAIFDALTGGNMIYYGPLAAAKVIAGGEQLKFLAGALTITLD